MAHSLRYCISHDHHENENKQTDTNPTSETNKRHYGWVSQGARAFALQIDTNALQIDTEHAESAQFMGGAPDAHAREAASAHATVGLEAARAK